MTAIHTVVFCWLAALAATAALAVPPVDPRGPIEYPGMHAVADQHGAQTPGYTYRNVGRKLSPWRAQWIWTAADPAPAVALLRKQVVLAHAPVKADAWLSADAKYRLYINGRLVSRGPVDIGRDYAGGSTGRWFYDYRDLTPYFKQGVNVIAAEVFRDWPIGFTVSRGQPGFLFEAELTLPGGKRQTVLSDTSWKCLPAPQYPNASTYDASREPVGWRTAGFDDTAWSASRAVRNVWEPLVPSEIPPLMEVRYPVQRIEGLPSRAVTGDSTFRVVFDRVLSAYPTLKVRGGKGATMTIRAHRSATFVLGEGEETFEFPFMTEIAPAFTVEIKNLTTPVEILDVGANFTSQPVAYRGAFKCSDPELNRIWVVSRWAVQICLQTHHLDSPNHQEPISDPGDYVIEAMVNNYAFAQPWLTRQDIRKFAWLLRDQKYHNFHTSYSIGWLQMLMDYYDYTGDRKLIEEMAPYVHELLDTYATWRGRNGILSEAPNYMFMDWVTIGGFECHHPPAVIGQGYLTAYYYHGLAMASRVAGMLGDGERVKKYALLRREIAEAFNRELWVAEKGLYRDGKPFQTSVKPHQWLPADKDIETFSPHVNLLAVLYDLAPKAEQKAIMDKVMSEKRLNTQPWFMHWVFQAIDHAGLFDRYGAAQMRRWKVVEETRSFHEMWDQGDLSHGWCSTPLVQMSAHVLGVTPGTPGFQSIKIRPEPCDLRWAKGRVPTRHGDVVVSWTLDAGRFKMDVETPPGCQAEVALPAGRFNHPKILANSHPASAIVRVGPGRHHFEVIGAVVSN